jgi:hypothetical protein
MAQVGSFLARAEAALGKLPAIPVVTPLAEPHAGHMAKEKADLYGCLSPRGRPNTSPLPIVSPTAESEAIARVVALVLQIMPELHELCEEPVLPMSVVHQMVDSPEASTASTVPLPPALLAPLEPSQTLSSVEREGLDDIVVHSTKSIGQVVSVDGNVVASGVVAPIPGALFAKKFYDFLVNLEADDPGSGKTIGCLLKEREMRNKSKVGSGILKEKSFKSKIKKSGASKKASTTA